jgi:hypothetical protein
MKKASKARKKTIPPKKTKKTAANVTKVNQHPDASSSVPEGFIELKQGVIYENYFEIPLTFRDDI